MFNVLKRIDYDVYATCTDQTLHANFRNSRIHFSQNYLGDFKLHSSYLVDTNHPNGIEIHSVYKNGVIMIANERTKKLITVLIARPNQLKRYGIEDERMLDLAYQHFKKGYNHF